MVRAFSRRNEPTAEVHMDLIYLALSAGLVLLSWGLIVACERLA
jgi:hypothetical protein